jgi:hypothetical protein
MRFANGQTVLKIGETVLTSLPLHHQSTSIKHRRIHHHFHRFLLLRNQYTHDNGWQCVDGMIESKWVSGDFIPQQLADVLKASICRNKTSEICQESPICARALWNWGDFCNVLIGLTFPFPLNGLVVSQRVNACHAFHITSYDGTSVCRTLNQLNQHRKKLIHELFFIVSMENNKDTEILEFVVRIPIYSVSSFTTRWNYKE